VYFARRSSKKLNVRNDRRGILRRSFCILEILGQAMLMVQHVEVSFLDLISGD